MSAVLQVLKEIDMPTVVPGTLIQVLKQIDMPTVVAGTLMQVLKGTCSHRLITTWHFTIKIT